MSTLIPIIVGGVLTLVGGAGTEWLRDRRSASSAREDRREARQEQRDDLQRNTMVDLQDAIQRYVRAVGAIVHFDEMTKRKHGTQTLAPDEMDGELHASQVLTLKLATRVRDDELRARDRQNAMGELSELVQERLGEYIRSL
jgi:hypothetical protein